MRRTLAAIALGLGACQGQDSSLGAIGDADGIASAGDDEATGTTTPTGGDAEDETLDDSSDDGTGIKLDVASPQLDLGRPPPCDREPCPACEAVDLLFVIENSPAMGPHQAALATAFAGFIDALASALPAGTNLHVGVTSTTMGFSAQGETTMCQATGDRGQPAAAFYETPDATDNGIDGAQGRLVLADGQRFFAVDSDASAAQLGALATWFSIASDLGETGSEIEMSAAGAGWALDPSNDATNAGFVRDERAVLVIVVMQDEPDQTPPEAAEDLVARIAAAKQGCGGMDCVVGGGFVDLACLEGAALGTVLDALGTAPVLAELPARADADALAPVLVDGLVPAIASACAALSD